MEGLIETKFQTPEPEVEPVKPTLAQVYEDFFKEAPDARTLLGLEMLLLRSEYVDRDYKRIGLDKEGRLSFIGRWD
jgi:hypothetical protein